MTAVLSFRAIDERPLPSSSSTTPLLPGHIPSHRRSSALSVTSYSYADPTFPPLPYNHSRHPHAQNRHKLYDLKVLRAANTSSGIDFFKAGADCDDGFYCPLEHDYWKVKAQEWYATAGYRITSPRKGPLHYFCCNVSDIGEPPRALVMRRLQRV